MDTLKVKREFLETTKDLANRCNVPEVRDRLIKLADRYNRDVEKLERETASKARHSTS
jgi:hypothetical protein